MLDVPLPIVQAPMAGVQDSALAIAVRAAGGLGSLPAAMWSPGQLEQNLRAVHDAGGGPYNVNFFCHQEPAPDPVREARWQARLRPYFDELGIDPGAGTHPPRRRPFDSDHLEVLEPFRPAFVSFHFGLPHATLVAQLHAWGTTVLSSATTVDEARWLADHGADVVIAQGIEAGGHRGTFRRDDLGEQLPVRALLPAIRAAIGLPVIAAGGISSPDAVREVLAGGAIAVQIGTAFLLTDEAQTSPLHRAALAERPARPTEITNVFTGRPARGIINRAVEELGPIDPEAPAFPLAAELMSRLRAAAERNGSTDFSPLSSFGRDGS